jgi:hypothetical protein
MIGMREILNEGEKCEKVRERERETYKNGNGIFCERRKQQTFPSSYFLTRSNRLSVLVCNNNNNNQKQSDQGTKENPILRAIA